MTRHLYPCPSRFSRLSWISLTIHAQRLLTNSGRHLVTLSAIRISTLALDFKNDGIDSSFYSNVWSDWPPLINRLVEFDCITISIWFWFYDKVAPIVIIRKNSFLTMNKSRQQVFVLTRMVEVIRSYNQEPLTILPARTFWIEPSTGALEWNNGFIFSFFLFSHRANRHWLFMVMPCSVPIGWMLFSVRARLS